MITTLAIDPSAGISKRHAVAMYHDDKLHAVNLVILDGNLFGIFHDGMTIAIEGQFQGLNSKSVIQLARGAGHIAGWLGCPLHRVEWVAPAAWKRAISPNEKAPKVKKLKQYQIHMRLPAILSPDELQIYHAYINTLGNQQLMMDIADCIGIGLVAVGRV